MLEGGTETMSNRIDQRIVEMSFENHKFEKGINESKGSLKEFSNALKNMGTGKEFSGLDSSVNSISSSFSILEQIGVGALRRIGEAAVNAGGSLIKSLTVDQLSEGLDKYQQKIEAVQTMVSAGYDFESVEKSMERLMWFSDETSYSFSDMAGNMAKFISSGVDLKTSEKAMQGIATWAAHSGKNSQAASIAMFNLSQAISMGYVDTLNWRSIMNQNMNTVMFKDIAIGVAEATGAIKKGEVTIQNFDSNLKDKWFTNDVLLKTLDQYASYAEKVKEVQDEMNFDTAKQAMDYMDAHADEYSDVLNQIGNAAFKASQESKSFMDSINATMDAVSSGWLKTYEIIFGTLYEAKANFSALTEVLWTVFAASAESRNEMLQLVKDAGGIKSVFQILKNMALALLTPLRSISQAFDQFFPPKTESQWIGLINILETISRRLIITEETADKIQRTFAGFFAVVDIGWEVVKFLGSALYEVVNVFIPLNGGIFSVTASIGDFLVVLNHVIKQSGVFQYGLLGVKMAAVLVRDMLTTVIGKVSEFAYALWTTDKPLEFIGSTIKNIFSSVIESIKTGTSWISGKFLTALSSIQKFLGSNFNINGSGGITEILRILREFIGFLINEASEGIKNFGDVINNLDFNKIATFVAGGILLMFINQLTSLTKTMEGFTTTANTFVTKLSKKLFGTTTKIKELAYVFGVLSASIFVLSRIPWEDMKTGLVGLAGAIALFVAAYGGIQAITVWSSKALNGIEVIKSTFSLVTLAGGLAILSIAISRISKLTDEGNVWKAVGIVGAMMVLLTAYQALGALVSLIPGTNKVSVSFALMNAGLLGLVGVIAILTKISPEALSTGLSKLWSAAIVITAVQTLFGIAARIGGGNKLAVNFLGMSVGIIALVGVLSILSFIDVRSLSKGVANALLLGGVLSAIQLMFNIAGRISGGVKFKTNILAMQVGLLSMIGMVALLSGEDQAGIQNGIKNIAKMAGIIAALEILTSVAARIGGGNKLQKILGSITLTMLSFTLLIGVISIYTPEQIGKGLLTITAMMGIIVAFETLTALTSKLGTNSGGVGAILGMVTSILAITASLILLSILDEEGLRNATIALSVAVTTVGVMAAGFGILLKSLSAMPGNVMSLTAIIQKIIPGFVVLASLVLATVALFGVVNLALGLIESVSWDSIGKFTVGLVAISALAAGFTVLAGLPSFSGGMNLLGLVPGFVAMTAVVLSTIGLFYGINLVLPIVQNLDWDSLGKFILGLGLIGVLVAGLTLLGPGLILLGSSFVPAITGTLIAIAGAALIITAFVGLAAGLEALFGNNPDFLINAIDKLVLVGNGLGRFIGAIAGGFKTEILVGYGEGLAGFANAIKGVDSGAFDGVESLAKALLLITGTAMIDGLSRFLNFGKNPGKIFGEQLNGIIGAFEGITAEDAKRASDIVGALAPMAENLKALADAAQSIPNSGGFLGAFFGDNDIDVFGVQLRSFIETLTSLDADNDVTHASLVLAAMTPMASNLKVLAKAAEKIPNSGGFIGAFLGNNDIDTFGLQLRGLIDTLKSLDADADVKKASSSLTVMSEEMLPALERFSALANGLKNSGGLKQLGSGNTTLSEFAKDIAKFVKELTKVDFTIVSPALASISEITESFNIIGKDVLDNATKSFKNNKEPFQKEIASVLDGASKTVNKQKSIIVSDITGIFTEVLSNSGSYVKDFKKLGSDIVLGLKTGIEGESVIATNAIKKVSNSVITASKTTFESASPSKVFETIGSWCTKGLANGISNETKTAVTASVRMSRDVEESVRDSLGVHSFSTIFGDIGGWVSKSLGTGIQNGKDGLLGIAKDLGIDTSNMTITGIKDGIAGGESSITSGISSLIDLLSETSKDTGAGIGDGMSDAMRNALSNSSTGIGGKKTKDVIKTELEKLQSILDDQKYYGQLSLEEELKAYEALRVVKGQKAEDYKKIDKEVYRLTKEIYEAQLSYIEEVTNTEAEAVKKREDLYDEYLANVESATSDSAKKLKDLQEKYDEDKFSDEEAARKKTKNADEKYHKDYNSILEKSEKEREKARTDYADKQKSLNAKLLSDIEAQNKAYENAVKSRADAIYNSYGLFAAVEEDPEVSGEELLKNLRDQGAALSEWQQSLEALKGRGVGDALIEELQSMGPASKAQIKALLQLTDGQLDEYVTLFQGKYAFARIKAETELEGLKQSTNQAIRDLNTQAALDLADLGYEFANSMSEINAQMSDDLSELKDTYTNTISEINADLEEKLTKLKKTFDKSTHEINTDTAEKLAKLEKEYDTSLATINTDTDKKLADLKESFTSTMKTVNSLSTEEFKKLIAENKVKLDLLNTDTKALLTKVESTYDQSGNTVIAGYTSDMKTLNTNAGNELDALQRTVVSKLNSSASSFEEAGYNASEGFATGIRNGVHLAVSAAGYLANQAVNTARMVLDEHSPSKVFFGIGKFVSSGFANGITEYAHQAATASKKMAEGPIAAVTQALASLETDPDLDIWEPVIAPVLDLSNITTNGLDGLLGKNIDLGVRSAKLAREINQNGNSEKSGTTTIVNNFDLTGLTVRKETDIDAIATKLYQKQQIAERGKGIRRVPTGR
jgi:hypothetical protein